MGNYAENELGEQQRQRDVAKNKALISLGFRAMGQDPETGVLNGGKTGDADYGKVIVWHIKGKKYIKLWPVDAAEGLALGGLSLDKPADPVDAI